MNIRKDINTFRPSPLEPMLIRVALQTWKVQSVMLTLMRRVICKSYLFGDFSTENIFIVRGWALVLQAHLGNEISNVLFSSHMYVVSSFFTCPYVDDWDIPQKMRLCSRTGIWVGRLGNICTVFVLYLIFGSIHLDEQCAKNCSPAKKNLPNVLGLWLLRILCPAVY